LVPGVLSGWGVKLNTHVHLVLRSGMEELCLYSPISFHGVMVN
jgi:hypothetical protein